MLEEADVGGAEIHGETPEAIEGDRPGAMFPCLNRKPPMDTNILQRLHLSQVFQRLI